MRPRLRRPSDRRLAQRRSLLAAAVLAVLGLATLASFFSWRQYDDGKQHALNEIDSRVVLAVSVFDTYFSGQMALLRSIASSDTVRSGNAEAMTAYFRRVQPPGGKQFTGGLGWVDLGGQVRASSSANPSLPVVNVADRAYFQKVTTTRKPFISAGLRPRDGSGRRLIVMAVPTFDTHGLLTGVLAGALNLVRSPANRPTIDLGFEGLAIIDRIGQQLTLASFARPQNTELLARMRKHGTELLPDTQGLDGSNGRVVAYATSTLPGWTAVIDRSPGSLFASARRSLVLEQVSIIAAMLLILGLLAWVFRRANRNARAERRRAEIATELTRSLAEASTPGAVAEALAVALTTTHPDALAVIGLRDEGSRGIALGAVRGKALLRLDRGQPALLEPALAAYESAEPLALSGQTAIGDRFPELQRTSGRRVASIFARPIVAPSGRRLGALALLFETQHRLSASGRGAIGAYVDQAVQALTRTVRQEREHAVALELQRSLLPEELPATDGLVFATRYNAGGVGVEVGGDWYDVVRRPDGILQMSVGDVAGRGIAAATLMAQLRNAFRAYALDHTSPAEITRRLLRHIPEGGMVTTVCLTLDPYSRRFSYSLAGHPPVLLLDRELGAVRALTDAGAPPLGFATPKTIKEASGTLPSRATLVAYTDGLVERRGTSIDSGIGLITSVVESADFETADELADTIIQAATGASGADDDAALIVVDFLGAPARLAIEIPSTPSLMPVVRHRLERWLELRGIAEDERIDAVLAVHEACVNAMEHGYQLGGGTVGIVLDHRRDSLHVLVEDQGEWRPPTPDPNRGRGIQIMEGTMDSTRIEHDRNGTRVALERRLTLP